ncbi:MAG TPA: LLM class flavin-dependent oxidoreductase, partial [Acidimicrobiia bacterium]|nr:LLM class flavin-dependent oxidoreductase [Acidimicrobiia bacterium]
PIPVVSAAMGTTAVRRAAALGAGILLDSLSSVERCRELTDTYRAAGGTEPCVLIRRAWIGEPFRAHVDAQVDVYRGYASPAAQGHWGDDELIAHDEPAAVAGQLAAVVDAAGADALNLRLHVPGIDPEAAREQLARLGDEVLGPLREALR